MKRALLSIACAVGLAVSLTPPAATAGQEAVLDGFGSDIPLSDAVRLIVPEGYVVSYGPGVDQSAKVSWSGGSDWRTVLETTARARRLAVSYDDRGVRITQAGAIAAAAPQSRTASGFVMVPYRAGTPADAPVPAAASAAPATPVVDAAKPSKTKQAEVVAPTVQAAAPAAVSATIAPPSPPAPPAQVWHAAQGDTLDEVMADWSEKAGWTLVFDSKMVYQLQASADFSGDFEAAATALVKSIEAHPKPQLRFFRGNRVARIFNTADQTN